MARVVVRLSTSAGRDEGRGHLTRSLSLAEAAWPETVDLELALARGELSRVERARATASGVRLVDPRAAVRRDGIVVVDAPDARLLAAGLEPGRLVVFDDRETFDGEAALIVQPSLPTWSGPARAGRVVAGYRWAPIGAAWRAWIGQPAAAAGEGSPRVVVCFGGSDPDDVTGRIAGVVAADRRWTTSVVVGPDYEGRAGHAVDVVRDPEDLPRIVARADLALIGAGTMKFEAAALGRPAILLAAADDQRPVGPPFAATGAAIWLGDGRTVDPELVRTTVADTLADASAGARLSTAARRQVDGAGADRLAAEISAVAVARQRSAS